jgi:hypothetical protein
VTKTELHRLPISAEAGYEHFTDEPRRTENPIDHASRCELVVEVEAFSTPPASAPS